MNTNQRIYLNYLKVLHVYSLLDVFWYTDIKRSSSTMKTVWMSISFYTVFTVVGLTQMRAPTPGLQLEHLSPCLWSWPTHRCATASDLTKASGKKRGFMRQKLEYKIYDVTSFPSSTTSCSWNIALWIINMKYKNIFIPFSG